MKYLNIVLWSLGIGVVLCNLYIYYNRVVLGAYVRKMLDKNAVSPENSLTLKEVGFENNILVKSALKNSSSAFVGVFSRIGEQNDKLYIPEEKKEKAIKMFSKKGSSLLVVILSSILILTLVFVSTYVIPYLIEMAKNTFLN